MTDKKSPADDLPVSLQAKQFVQEGMSDPPDEDADQAFFRLMGSVQRRIRLLELLDNDALVELSHMSPEGVEFLRRLGTDEGTPTLKWLVKADKDKLGKVDAAIQFMDNAQFMSKWTIIFLGTVGTVITFVIGIYNAFFKGQK